jgi:import receptor subunit TOM5
MYGGQPLSESEKKAHQEVTKNSLKMALYIAGALWVAPIAFHFVQRQFK